MAHPVFANAGSSIFESMSRLSQEVGSINLGQGFPEGLEPQVLIDAAIQALKDGPHQYPPMMGIPALRKAVADNAKRFLGLDVDWETEVLVTSGATEALADTFLALLEQGDEVIVFEPVYDSYSALIRRSGAVPVPVRLQPPEWRLPEDDLRAAITPRTKAILINTPMNPIGKIFDDKELSLLSAILLEFDLLAIADEVYEHLIFDGRKHRTLYARPELKNRVVRIGSAGKTFSVTGWKVGYITAGPALLGAIARAHAYVTFTTPPALQAAVAVGLALPDSYFLTLRRDLETRRNRLVEGLQEVGFDVAPVEATYFAVADIRAFDRSADDLAFARKLTLEAGVTTIPVSSFYGARDVTSHVRFCFAKNLSTLDEAITRLKRWRQGQIWQAA